jgi:cyanate permease
MPKSVWTLRRVASTKLKGLGSQYRKVSTAKMSAYAVVLHFSRQKGIPLRAIGFGSGAWLSTTLVVFFCRRQIAAIAAQLRAMQLPCERYRR